MVTLDANRIGRLVETLIERVYRPRPVVAKGWAHRNFDIIRQHEPQTFNSEPPSLLRSFARAASAISPAAPFPGASRRFMGWTSNPKPELRYALAA